MVQPKGPRVNRKAQVAMVRTNQSAGDPNAIRDYFRSIHLEGIESFIECVQLLMAGDVEYESFKAEVVKYDDSRVCGLVWGSEYIAYRCRTCSTYPCMSLCSDCFRDGNHEGHDFNIFRSHAGGACDCGDASVMVADGFCRRHRGLTSTGGRSRSPSPATTKLLLDPTEWALPHVFSRLLALLRHKYQRMTSLISDRDLPLERSGTLSFPETDPTYSATVRFLKDLNSMGVCMRVCQRRVLLSNELYQTATEDLPLSQTEQAFHSQWLPSLTTLDDEAGAPMQVRNFMDEICFWLVKFELPSILLCWLLSILPDAQFKTEFSKLFCTLYPRFAKLLFLSSGDTNDRLSNGIVHASVQLHSNPRLAVMMHRECHVLQILLDCQRKFFSKCAKELTNRVMVLDCSSRQIRGNSYWTLTSDFANFVHHREIFSILISEKPLLETFFDVLTFLQGMNVNVRQTIQHIEFEQEDFHAAFMSELEISSSPLANVTQHIDSALGRQNTEKLLSAVVAALSDWLVAVSAQSTVGPPRNELSFHWPLHRWFSLVSNAAIINENLDAGAFLGSYGWPESCPDQSTAIDYKTFVRMLLAYPLHCYASVYEIHQGLWVRNGMVMQRQAEYYIHDHFASSHCDADLFLIQLCVTLMDPDEFVDMVLERFGVKESLSLFEPPEATSSISSDRDKINGMIESLLEFLCRLFSVRVNLGVNDADQLRSEIVMLLAVQDRKHSMVTERLPEQFRKPHNNLASGNDGQLTETILDEVADKKISQQGPVKNEMVYFLRDELWLVEFDPIFTAHRSFRRGDCHDALNKFYDVCKRLRVATGNGSLWPPYRVPAPLTVAFGRLVGMLHCRSTFSVLFTLLYRAVFVPDTSNETQLGLVVFLLEMAAVTWVRDRTATRPYQNERSLSSARSSDRVGKWFNGCCGLFELFTKEVEEVQTTQTSGCDQSPLTGIALETDMAHGPGQYKMFSLARQLN